jgi:hypothetical protein
MLKWVCNRHFTRPLPVFSFNAEAAGHPRQGADQRPVDGCQDVRHVLQTRILRRRPGFAAQIANDFLELVGIEHAGGFRERPHGKARYLHSIAHILELAGFLHAPHRFHAGVQQIQNHHPAIPVEAQFAIVGPVPRASNVAQPI